MRGATGPQWAIYHEVPSDINCLFWLRRRWPGMFAESAWQRWLDALGHGPSGPWPEAIAAHAPVPEWGELCRERWLEFVRAWEPARLQLERRVFEIAQRARLRDIMGQSNAHITLLQTDEPGRFARNVGRGWVLGTGYLDPVALRELISAIRPVD